MVRFHLKAPHAGVAQLAEQLICNQQVVGSSPITGSTACIAAPSETDRFQSGQMDQTVNLTSQTSVVRIHLCPPKKDTRKVSFFGCAGGKKNAVFTAVCSRNENRKPFNSITFPNVFSKAKFYPYFLLAFLFKTCYNQ